jgi:hypothetical protein
MIEIDWIPAPRKLREFALLLAGLLALWALRAAWETGFLAGAPFEWNTAWRLVIVRAALAFAIAGAGVIVPRAFRPVYVGWMLIAYPISWLVSNVLLAITYFFLFTTIATIFRLLGRDELRRRFDRGASTYWRERGAARPTSHYFKQF